MPLRFHLDEHISMQIAAGLRRRNIDTTTAADVGLIGASDEDHLAFARKTGRILLTQDADFLRIHARGTAHNGIVYFRQQPLTVGEVPRRVVLLHDLVSTEEIAGRVEFL